MWKGRHDGRLSHGYLCQDGFSQALKVFFCVEGVEDEQSLTSRGLKSGEEKPQFVGVGDLTS